MKDRNKIKQLTLKQVLDLLEFKVNESIDELKRVPADIDVSKK